MGKAKNECEREHASTYLAQPNSLAGLQAGACGCTQGCAELKGVRDGVCGCIHGCAELTRVREGACGCIPVCLELTRTQEGAFDFINC
eukprot:1196159-Prorocentrum_minimum.AAC.2